MVNQISQKITCGHYISLKINKERTIIINYTTLDGEIFSQSTIWITKTQPFGGGNLPKGRVDIIKISIKKRNCCANLKKYDHESRSSEQLNFPMVIRKYTFLNVDIMNSLIYEVSLNSKAPDVTTLPRSVVYKTDVQARYRGLG